MSAKLYGHDAVFRDLVAGMSGQMLNAKHGCPSNPRGHHRK